MTSAFSWLDATLKQVPLRGCALYIRHAVRSNSAHSTVRQHLQAQLATGDQELARSFGTRLSGRIGAVVSAPQYRSTETAKCLLEGATMDPAALRVDGTIGDPSAYVLNEESLTAEMSNLPLEDLHSVLLRGMLRPASWANPDPIAAAWSIQTLITNTISNNPGKISIFIAPNTAIAATVALALRKEKLITHRDCPPALEGAVFYTDRKGVWLAMGSYQGYSRL